MTHGPIEFIDAGTSFDLLDITHWADRPHRSLDVAIAEADLLVTCPHAGAEIPAELAPWLAPGLSKRLQFDVADVSTRAVARRWAEIDPSIVYLENPHPRLVRDPDRPRPEDPADELRRAMAQAHTADDPVDLGGIEFLRVPDTDADLDELVQTLLTVAERGMDVYQRARTELVRRLLATRPASPNLPITTMSLHDTMNHLARRDGSVAVERAVADRLPDVMTLSNRGDVAGNPRSADPAVTMDPERLRVLADSFRAGFRVSSHDEVALNRPQLGGDEIISAARKFSGIEIGDRRAVLDSVHAEFRREYLLGEEATAELGRPGTDWPETDEDRVTTVAKRLRKSWTHYRATVG